MACGAGIMFIAFCKKNRWKHKGGCQSAFVGIITRLKTSQERYCFHPAKCLRFCIFYQPTCDRKREVMRTHSLDLGSFVNCLHIWVQITSKYGKPVMLTHSRNKWGHCWEDRVGGPEAYLVTGVHGGNPPIRINDVEEDPKAGRRNSKVNADQGHMEEAGKGGDTVGGKKDGWGEGPTGMEKGKKQTVTQGSLCRKMNLHSIWLWKPGTKFPEFLLVAGLKAWTFQNQWAWFWESREGQSKLSPCP